MLAQRLAELRVAHGYTKKKIGELLNMSPEGYGHYESGKRTPSPTIIKTLADLYSVTTDYILGVTDNPTPQNKKAPDESEAISDDDIMFALFDGDAGEITDEMFNEVKEYAKFVQERKKRQKDGRA